MLEVKFKLNVKGVIEKRADSGKELTLQPFKRLDIWPEEPK